MLYGIIFFLLVAVVIVAGFAAVLVMCLQDTADTDGIMKQFEDLQTEHTRLQAEKAALEEAALGYLSELRTVRLENSILADEILTAREVGKFPDTSSTLQPESVIPEEILTAEHTNKMTCEPYLVERGGVMTDAFDKNSDQARLQEDCATDPATGIRYYYNGSGTRYLCAALGHAFGVEIGMAYEVTLRCGTVLPVMLADYRHPIDPEHRLYSDLGIDPAADYGDRYEIINDSGTYRLGDRLVNYDGQGVLAVLEFVADMRVIPHDVRMAGTMTALPQFGGLYGDGGDIVKITKTGRVWTP